MWTLFLSVKYFLSRRKERMISLIGWISVVGVALGVASLIIVMSVMNGFDREVQKKIIGTYSHIVIMKEGGIYPSGDLTARIMAVPGVVSVSPFMTGQAVLRRDDTVTGILLKAIDPEKEQNVTDVIKYTDASAGDLEGQTIVLGSELMKSERIELGDRVEIMVPYSATDMEKRKLTVIGSFTSGRYDYDSNLAVVSLSTARSLFRTEGQASGLALRLEEAMEVAPARDALQRMLGHPYTVKTWMDLDRNLVTALALEKKMMFIILALIVTVACFNISSSLIMMVMEKTRDIGILKAIGASSAGISTVFFTEGAMIGLGGVLLGTSCGVFLSSRINQVAALLERFTGVNLFPSDVYYFTTIPVEISTSDVVMITVLAMALTLAAGVYPAWKASRLDPVEAIRYE
ncbi:MAG: FtsX-like permease family protein [Candidatus Omnitrophica bacterium]|nr:FtsX-like permease family protein [Candidatus Omnitrophota bacterium]